MTESSAATQRNSKTDYIVKLWVHLQTRINGVVREETTFEELTKFMSDSKNMKLTCTFYTILSSFCNKEPIKRDSFNTKDKQSPNMKKARLILSGLLISKFPLDVLDVHDLTELDPASEACYKSSQQMIDSILNFDTNASSTPNKLECDRVLKSINHFVQQFSVWKNQDLEKVLDSLVSYYEQWLRSHSILEKSSMNEAQKKVILNTLIGNMNKTQTRMAKLVGTERATVLCQQIKEKVSAEPEPEHPVPSQPATQPTHAANQEEEAQDEEIKEDESLEQQLAKKGVPINMKSGRNLLTANPMVKNSENENKQPDEEDETAKYVKEVNGQKMLDLDAIIMEEASKRYWSDFSKQIEASNYSRLFELLSELLERLRKLSPEKQHKYLDDMLDVKFIEQTIENGAIDGKAFYAIFYGIWSQIKALHSPNEDEEWQRWHDYVLQQFGNENATWGSVLAQVFNVFLRKMDKIEDQIKVIQMLQEQKKQSNSK